MQERRFYILWSTVVDETHLMASGRVTDWSGHPCPACNRFIEEQHDAYHAVIDHLGRRGFVDVLHVADIWLVLRQDLVDLWRAHGLTGFSATPVHVTGWSKRTKKPFPTEVPEYYWVQATSFVRLLEPPLAESPCPVCHRAEYAFPKDLAPLPHGTAIDEASWDGSDFFGVFGYSLLICTREVAELTLRAGYNKHLAFMRLEEFATREIYDSARWTHEEYANYYESFYKRRVEDL